MDIADSYVALTEGLLRSLHMGHPLAHVHAGLAIYLGVQFVLRTRRASAIALQAVIGAELVNEILERAAYGSWRWADTSADIALTLFWPCALYALSGYRRARWERWRAARQAAAAAGPLALLRSETVRALGGLEYKLNPPAAAHDDGSPHQ